MLLPLRSNGRRWISYFLIALVVGDAGCWTLRQPVKWVRGYSDAATFVLAHTDGPGIVLFDGHFDGTFIYAVRNQDADRRLWRTGHSAAGHRRNPWGATLPPTVR